MSLEILNTSGNLIVDNVKRFVRSSPGNSGKDVYLLKPSYLQLSISHIFTI